VFRKVCHLIADMDEWGQIAALAILTPYARTQFVDPSPEAATARDAKKKAAAAAAAGAGADAPAADARPKTDEDDDDGLQLNVDAGELDPDHRLLLRSTQPLLQSRSSAVVFGVITLYLACAPSSDLRVVSKAMCRLVKGSRESQVRRCCVLTLAVRRVCVCARVQWLALMNCASVASAHPDLLRPHLSEFFVGANDAAGYVHAHVSCVRAHLVWCVCARADRRQ
jgi:AP-3 complex subunit beta